MQQPLVEQVSVSRLDAVLLAVNVQIAGAGEMHVQKEVFFLSIRPLGVARRLRAVGMREDILEDKVGWFDQVAQRDGQAQVGQEAAQPGGSVCGPAAAASAKSRLAMQMW